MAYRKHFDDLPYEIVLKIFTYLNIEDLRVSTQNVSLRWREVSQDSRLWRNVVFSPQKEMTDKEIVKCLKNMPALQSYSATRSISNLIIDTMCRRCREIRSIEFHKADRVNNKNLQKIIQYLPKIESLKLSCSYILWSDQFKFTDLIGQCKSLTTLNLVEYSEISLELYEGHPTPIVGCPLVQAPYEGWLIPIANGCPLLQHMHLGYFGQIHEDIQNLLGKRREHLLSFSCKICMTKEIAENISECTRLRHLNIENYDDSLLYDDIKSLIKLTNLRYFIFRYCSEDVVNNLPTFFRDGSFSQIIHLDLSESYYINDITVTMVFENFPQLQHLNISGGQSLHNEGLQYIGKCSQLKHLDVSVCMDLTDGSMEYVGAGCHNLKHLDVSGCYKMTDKVIEYIVKCTELQVLKFNYNDLTGSNLYLISCHLPKLAELHLENCKYLNELHVDKLHKKMTNLKIIVARRCKEPYLDPEEAVLLFD